MTQTSTSRRVATVSGGALLLCLSFGGTAMAATSPVSGSDTSPISSISGALPLPTPTDSPDPVGTVTQTIKTVTQTAGVPVPTTTPTATPTVAPAPASGAKAGTTKHAPVPVTKPARHASGRVLGVHQARVAPMTTSALPALQLGGLRGAASVPTISNPVVAPEQTAVLAAGQAPALAPQPKAALPFGSDESAPRGLFIALATMVIGGLAAGHVKVIQDRLNGISVA
jgi:hypothetical protein